MPLKFRLRGLAETFVEGIRCPSCHNEGGEGGEQGFATDLTKVTYDGIVVVVRCEICGQVFVPENQKFGIVNSSRLRKAVEKDSQNTGQPIFPDIKSVRLEVERLNAGRQHGDH